MPTSALLALATLLLAGPAGPAPVAPATETAKVCVTGRLEPRRDPLLSFLSRLELTAEQAKARPLPPARKALLLSSLDDKIRRANARRDYLKRRMSDLARDLSDIEAFERRAAEVRAVFEAATTEVMIKESPRKP